MNMLKISAVEFQRDIERHQDLALSQPVTITRNDRDSTVLISAEEYLRLKRRDREVLGLEDPPRRTLPPLKLNSHRPKRWTSTMNSSDRLCMPHRLEWCGDAFQWGEIERAWRR